MRPISRNQHIYSRPAPPPPQVWSPPIPRWSGLVGIHDYPWTSMISLDGGSTAAQRLQVQAVMAAVQARGRRWEPEVSSLPCSSSEMSIAGTQTFLPAWNKFMNGKYKDKSWPDVDKQGRKERHFLKVIFRLLRLGQLPEGNLQLDVVLHNHHI